MTQQAIKKLERLWAYQSQVLTEKELAAKGFKRAVNTRGELELQKVVE